MVLESDHRQGAMPLAGIHMMTDSCQNLVAGAAMSIWYTG